MMKNKTTTMTEKNGNPWTTDIEKTIRLCDDLKASGFTVFIQIRYGMPTLTISRTGHIMKVKNE